MAGPRPEKVAVVEEVREHLANSDAAILTEYRGLKVGDLAALRRQLRTAGAEYKIFKNTLVRRATAGTDQAGIDPYLQGPTAIAFVHDDIGAVAKVLRDFSRVHPELVVKGGLLGTKLVDAKGAGALADLPSREALLAQIAGVMAAPMRQFAGLLQALPRSFAYGLSALIEKLGGPAPGETESLETAALAPEPTEAAEAIEPLEQADSPQASEALTETVVPVAQLDTAEPVESVAPESAETAESAESAATESAESAESAETTGSPESSETTGSPESAETTES